MRYHFVEGEQGHCDCGRHVRAVVRGFGPQTHFVYLDADGGETCDA